jgi:outer membrane protein assembly factor BamB
MKYKILNILKYINLLNIENEKMKTTLFILAITLFIPLNLFTQNPSILWKYELNSVSFGNSCAGDIDNDGKLEIVFSTYFNDETIYALNAEDGSLLWKYVTNGCNDAAPLIYDVDNDGKLEVLLQSSTNQHLFCFNGSDGSIKWMVNSNGTDSPPSIVDADNDGKPEILDGDFYGNLTCYNAEDGSLLWETKVDSLSSIQTEPVIEDVDGDGELDCVVATWCNNCPNKIAAYKIKDGSNVWVCNAPSKMLYHGPTIADIDKDNIKEVIIGDYDGILYCLNGTNGTVKWTYNYMFGDYPGYVGAPTTIGDINSDGKYEIAFINYYKLGILNNDGTLLWDYDMPEYSTSFRGVVFADMNNDKNLDVVFGNSAGFVSALNGRDGSTIFDIDLKADYGKTFDINNAPLIADFNNDGLLDIFIVGGYTEYPETQKNYGRAYMISTVKSTGPDWLMFRSNIRRNAVIPIIPTSIEDITKGNSEFLISPNPAADYITIQPSEGLKPSEGSGIQIFDMLGIPVSPAGVGIKGGGKIDISNLSPGIYFIKIGNRVDKFVKM